MRHIPLTTLLKQVFADASGKKEKKLIFTTQARVARKPLVARQRYTRRYGSRVWSGVKNLMIARMGNKCWYTEVEIIGADLTVDHFRPIRDYWFLAFDPHNYRVACPYSNSLHHNPLYGRSGGKHDNFPLIGKGAPASGRNKLRREQPVILDPCNKNDCELLAFQVDGRPILNPKYALDSVAVRRVDESKILLNLDHPDFNSKREQLYRDIVSYVNTHEELAPGAASRKVIRNRLRTRLGPKAEFSTAARFYLQLYRHLDWVEDLLNAP